MNENEVKGICASLAYSIKSVVEGEATLTYAGEGGEVAFKTIERLIISEFFHALNRRGFMRNNLIDPQIAHTLDRLAYYRSPESRRIHSPQTDMHTDTRSPLNSWRKQGRF